MPREAPQSFSEFFSNLPNATGAAFWFGLALLVFGIFIIFRSSSNFASDIHAIKRARIELAHLLISQSAGSAKSYQHRTFSVPSKTLHDEDFELDFEAVTLVRKTEIMVKEKYTERDQKGNDVTRYRSVWKPLREEGIFNPEQIDVQGFKLASALLKKSQLPITERIPTDNPMLLGNRQMLEDGYLRLIPNERADNEIHYNDERVSYYGATAQTISTVAKIENGALHPYKMNSFGYLLENGEKSVEQLIQSFIASSKSGTIFALVIGSIVLTFGGMCIYAGYLGRTMNGTDALFFLRYTAFLGLLIITLGYLKGYFLR